MINTKLFVIIFAIAICVSVTSLILYDQMEKNTIRETYQKMPCSEFTDTMLNSNPIKQKAYDDRMRECNVFVAITDDSAMLKKVLDHCEAQRYGEENNWKTPSGGNLAVTSIGLEFNNGTHYIDNNECEWLPICTSDRSACFPNDPINCVNTIWDCHDTTYDEDFTDDFEIDYTENFGFLFAYGEPNFNPVPELSNFAPLKQLKQGIAIQDIECKNGLFLIHKRITLSPACVSDKAFNELILPNYGWAVMRLGPPSETITQELLCTSYPDVELVQRSCDDY